jgi:hypothetical protein
MFLRYYVTAVDYEHYVIVKGCPFITNERKYVPCKCIKRETNRTKLGSSKLLKSDVLFDNGCLLIRLTASNHSAPIIWILKIF